MESADSHHRPLRIGEVADRVGVTARTIRYYEERGLLGRAAGCTKGAHRVYGEADVVRLQELIRLRDLLGLVHARRVTLADFAGELERKLASLHARQAGLRTRAGAGDPA